MHREELKRYLDSLLETSKFRDYCPNGLQVEGNANVRRIVLGVSACQALLDAAVARAADTVLVHHGYFWRGEDPALTGMKRRRVGTLIEHDMNLFAFHLPLDAHPEFGNNAVLAKLAGWYVDGRFGEQDIGFLGRPVAPDAGERAGDFAARLESVLNRCPLLVGNADRPVRRIAWCSGGAQGYFEAAIAAGADLFVSGEISEQTFHIAQESGVPYIAAGHHATERFGVQSVGAHLSERFGLECQFIEIENPV